MSITTPALQLFLTRVLALGESESGIGLWDLPLHKVHNWTLAIVLAQSAILDAVRRGSMRLLIKPPCVLDRGVSQSLEHLSLCMVQKQ
jgi:hypothetical protein